MSNLELYIKAESLADVNISISACYPSHQQHFSANWMFPPRLTYSPGRASAVQCDEFLTLTDGSVRGVSVKNTNNPDRAARQKNSSFNPNKY